MGVFADELRAGIDEAANKMEAARRDGNHFGAEADRERLAFLRRVAYRHGLGPGRAGGLPESGREPAASMTAPWLALRPQARADGPDRP